MYPGVAELYRVRATGCRPVWSTECGQRVGKVVVALHSLRPPHVLALGSRHDAVAAALDSSPPSPIRSSCIPASQRTPFGRLQPPSPNGPEASRPTGCAHLAAPRMPHSGGTLCHMPHGTQMSFRFLSSILTQLVCDAPFVHPRVAPTPQS